MIKTFRCFQAKKFTPDYKFYLFEALRESCRTSCSHRTTDKRSKKDDFKSFVVPDPHREALTGKGRVRGGGGKYVPSPNFNANLFEKKNFLLKKGSTWPLFHCFGTPIWPP